jgi:hypothetical protein
VKGEKGAEGREKARRQARGREYFPLMVLDINLEGR